jgi:toxin-antitoxin system PIN domain toxin
LTERIQLPDVNVLVAVAWPNHLHHAVALRWFEQNHRRGWATTPLTESGFVRVSSNRRVVPSATRPAEAIALLKQLTGLAGHRFWADDISIARSKWVAVERLLGHSQVTDAHLLAIAMRRSGRLVTFDGGVVEILPDGVAREQVLRLLG